MNNSLLILQFNANGFKNHTNELQSFVFNNDINFTKYSHIYIPGYKIIKTNHPDGTAHSGILILVKTFLFYEHLPNYSYDHIQHLLYSNKIEQNPNNYRSILLLSMPQNNQRNI